jgi:Zn-dependent peptidase ImmA (M78 family)/DNA-binding XRE family transcriptional regulator
MASSSFPIDVNPAVLRWARSASGQATSEVAARAKISEKTLGEWEAGKSRPTWTSLKRLAKCYQRPVASLLLPEPPARHEIPTDFRTRAGTRHELSPPTLLAIRTARWLQSRAIEMRRDLDPAIRFGIRKISEQDNHQTIAKFERKRLGVDLSQQLGWQDRYEAFRAWKNALSELGILVFQFRFPRKELQGFSLFDKTVPVIVVNEEDAVEARIFTLFHEYAHLLLREPGMCLPTEVDPTSNKSIEPFCNRFASSLLVPDDEARQWPVTLTGSLEDDALIKQLASRYRVSKDVVLIKLRITGHISEIEFRKILNRWEENRDRPAVIISKPPTKQKGGRSALKRCIHQRGMPFMGLVIESLKRGVITDHDALNFLDIKVGDLDKLEKKR